MIPKPIKDGNRRATSMSMETNVPFKMRDGTTYYADIYFPNGGGVIQCYGADILTAQCRSIAVLPGTSRCSGRS